MANCANCGKGGISYWSMYGNVCHDCAHPVKPPPMTADQTQAVTAERTWTVFNGAGAVEVENASDDELRDVLTDARLTRGWTACSCVVVRNPSDLAALSSPVAAQPADSAMEVLRELVAIEDLQRSRAQAEHHAAKFPSPENYVVVDKLWSEIARRRTAAWDRARALTRQGDTAA